MGMSNQDPNRTMSGHKKVSGKQMALMAGAFVALCLVLVVPGALRNNRTSTATTRPVATQASIPNRSRDITKASFEQEWPFTIDAGVLSCVPPNRVFLLAEGVRYGVNTTAKNKDEDIQPIEDIVIGRTLGNDGLYAVIDAGLALCEE